MSDPASDLAWARGRLATEVKRRTRAERKHAELLAEIARAVVLELRDANYIEVHTELPDTKESP